MDLETLVVQLSDLFLVNRSSTYCTYCLFIVCQVCSPPM